MKRTTDISNEYRDGHPFGGNGQDTVEKIAVFVEFG